MTNKLKLHFLGIGGSGASAAAAIAQAQGYIVTGCDNDQNSEFLKPFSQDQLFQGHSPNHLICHAGRSETTDSISKDSIATLQNDNVVDFLIVTPAIFSLDPNNPELLEAKAQNIPILTWQQFVGKYLMKDKFVIAICGTHGKSTTTAMISLMLEDAGLDPTVILGAVIPKWGSNYRIGNSQYFVVEADEFNENFLFYTPDISVVTTIEMDHPEYFKDLTAVKESFKKFLSKTKQTIVANLGDNNIASVIENEFTLSLPKGGNLPSSENPHVANAPQDDNLVNYSKHLIDFPLKIPGEHNIYNASAAYQVGLELNIDPEIIKKSLSNFTGAARRFEKVGSVNGAEIYSDFGHHPTEIKVTMETARKKFLNKQIWVIFQPHMFARTKGLFADFVQVFKELPVDGVAIFDIYPSREIDTGLVSSKQLVEAINQKNVEYAPNWEEFAKVMKAMLSDQDVVFFMGAGDTDKWAKQLIQY